MGSATIVTNKGSGLYVIKLIKGTQSLQTNQTALQNSINDLTNAITDLEIELLSLTADLISANTALGDALAVFRAAEHPTAAMRKAVTDATTAALTAEARVNAKTSEINRQKIELTSLQTRLARINEVLEDDLYEAWCTDYSDELSGTVGTIEINGETDKIIIMPGGETGEGLVYDSAAMTPSGLFYNLALLPCWQKYMPTYRIGTIVSVDTARDTCSVALDNDRSRVKGLNINMGGSTYNLAKNAETGWTDFAARHPSHPLVVNTESSTLPMTEKLRQDLDAVQSDVNNRYTYRLDQQVYNKLEYWSSMGEGGSGDCEDFAITKAEKLIAMGYPASAIHIEVGMAKDTFWNFGGQPEQVGHAWLVVQTDDGDYCLDNNYKNVVRNEETGYTDRKRQTGTSWNMMGRLYQNVDIDYMDCDSLIFREDDKVVVMFENQDWDKPTVIGFEENPRQSLFRFVYYAGKYGGGSDVHLISASRNKSGGITTHASIDILQEMNACVAIYYTKSLDLFSYYFRETNTGILCCRLVKQTGEVTQEKIQIVEPGYSVDITNLGPGTFDEDDLAYFWLHYRVGGWTQSMIYEIKRGYILDAYWIYSPLPENATGGQKLCRFSDGTLLWYSGSEFYHGGHYTFRFAYQKDGVTIKTVDAPTYAFPVYMIEFAKEVKDKLVYGVWIAVAENVMKFELRLCANKYNPLSYSVMDIGQQFTYGAYDTPSQEWRYVTETAKWDDAYYYLGSGGVELIVAANRGGQAFAQPVYYEGVSIPPPSIDIYNYDSGTRLHRIVAGIERDDTFVGVMR